MASIDDIVRDVEAQPSTRHAVERLVERLSGAVSEAVEGDTASEFASELRDQRGDLVEAVVRVAEKPTGFEGAGAGQPQGGVPGVQGQSSTGDESAQPVEQSDEQSQVDEQLGQAGVATPAASGGYAQADEAFERARESD